MPKHKTRNTFYRITCEINTSLLMKFGQFMSYSKRNNFIKKIVQKLQPQKNSSRPFYVCKKLSTTVQFSMDTLPDEDDDNELFLWYV